MAQRLEFGEGYETTNSDGEEVTRYKHWIDVSSSLMSRVTAETMNQASDYDNANEVLADILNGDFNLDSEDSEDSED